jgi:acetylornithine deacetylase
MSSSVVSLLQDLIRIPSCNPDAPAGTEHTGEAEIAGWLADFLSRAGAEVVVEDIRPGRPNLIARMAPLDGRPRVLLGPHLDTVGVEGMTIDPFAAEIRDGRVWGRGASDTKGPMAAMLWGWLANSRELAAAPVAVDFVAFMGEESGQWGSRDFAAKRASDYRFAVVGEPTSMRVVRATKGSMWATLRARGRAAHSSQPERGDNALVTLARAVAALDDALARRLAPFAHPEMGRATHNFGTFHSGTRANVVPDSAFAEIDIRTTPGVAGGGGALAILHAAIAETGFPIEVTDAHDNPPMETPADHPDVRLLAAHGCPADTAPWFSDAAHLAAGGLAAVCLGPGCIDQAHTADEHIRIDALEEGAAMFTRIIKSLINPHRAANVRP